jgi:hypothetical protein
MKKTASTRGLPFIRKALTERVDVITYGVSVFIVSSSSGSAGRRGSTDRVRLETGVS